MRGQFRSSVQKVSRGYPARHCATGSSWEDRRPREPSGRRRAGPLVSAAVATQREDGKAGPDQGGLGANTVAFPWRYRYAGWGSGQCPVSTGRVRSDLPGRGKPQDGSQGKERILRPLWLLPVRSVCGWSGGLRWGRGQVWNCFCSFGSFFQELIKLCNTNQTVDWACWGSLSWSPTPWTPAPASTTLAWLPSGRRSMCAGPSGRKHMYSGDERDAGRRATS